MHAIYFLLSIIIAIIGESEPKVNSKGYFSATTKAVLTSIYMNKYHISTTHSNSSSHCYCSRLFH